MKQLKVAILAIALFFTAVLPSFAETAPTKAAVIQMISKETRYNKVAKNDIVRIVNAVFAEAKKHNIDPFLIISLINTESKFRTLAKNKSGARGLTQVIPRWHREKIKGRDIMHIETNIEVGTKVLVDCLDRNKGMNQALRCYSGGARNYTAKLKNGHTQLREADIAYRLENNLPLVVVAKFDAPRKFSIPVSATPLVAQNREMPREFETLYASNVYGNH